MKAFHVTPSSNLDRILTDGLVPAIGPRSLELGELNACVYMFPSMDDMEDALGNWLGEALEDSGDLALLAVDLTDIPVYSPVAYELTVSQTIPANRIRLQKTLTN